MPPSVSDSEKVAILFYASFYFCVSNSVLPWPYLEKAYGVIGRCAARAFAAKGCDPRGWLFIWAPWGNHHNETDRMKGELEEILKGTSCGEGETMLQHLVDFLSEWEALKFLGLPPHPAGRC